VATWEQNYLLRAPAAGRVSFFKPLTQDQFVAAAEPVMAVVPDGGGMVARVQVSQEGAGRVQRGQKVLLSFAGFPQNEWGLVRGRVQRISLLAFREQPDQDAVYLLEVALPEGMLTTSRKRIPFRQEMEGRARVVTQDLRMIDRVFNQLRQLVTGAADRPASPGGGR
jgi:multidrug resistance efflux pump